MRRPGSSILFVALVTQGFAVGTTVGVFTLFVEPLEQAFAAPRAQVSSGNSLIVVALSLAGTFVGGFFDRGWARRVMLCGVGLLGSALLLASLSARLWMLGLAALVAGVAIPMIGPLAGISLVTRTFAEDRGRAMGIVSMGPPLGSGLFAGLVGWALPIWGWRGSYGLLAVLTWAVLLPLVWLGVPSRLEGSDPGGPPGSAVLDTRTIARMPVFWLTALVFTLMAGIATGWNSQLGPYLGALGLDERGVAALIASQFWIGIPGALLFGALSDRVSLTALYLVILAYQGFAYGVYAAGAPATWIGGLVIVFGFLGGGMIPLFSLLLGRRVGVNALGRAMGLSNLLLLPFTVGSITLASVVYDRTGRYSWALALFAAGIGIAIVCLLLSNREARKRAVAHAREVAEGV
jgi:predicted MFS family arabinose efflux permease